MVRLRLLVGKMIVERVKAIFNPTMVRLRPLVMQRYTNAMEVNFQSHYGAIATADYYT